MMEHCAKKSAAFCLALLLTATGTGLGDPVLEADFEPPQPANPLDPMFQVGMSGRSESDWSISTSSIGVFSNSEACNVGGTGLRGDFTAVRVDTITMASFDLTHPRATAVSPAFMNVQLFFDGVASSVDVLVNSTSGSTRTIDLLSDIQAQTGERLTGIQLNGYVNLNHGVDGAMSVTCVDNIQVQAVPEPAAWISFAFLTLVFVLKQPAMIGRLKHHLLSR